MHARQSSNVRKAPPGTRTPSPAVLGDAQLVALADTAFAGLGSIVLAVSGGADSLALLLMADLWRAKAERPDRHTRDLPIHVATVDHGLRREAAAEAAGVAAFAQAKGFPAHVLTWDGPKPTSGLQAAARAARYALLVDLVRRLDLPRPAGVIVAHHLDDQAETFLMRLARGSGIDGLAAMAFERPLELTGGDVVLRRPLLGVPKAALVATLEARGWSRIEDPSNADTTFERVRVRRSLDVLADLGVDADALATSARRLARARAALEASTRDLARLALRSNAGAFAEIDAAAFDAAPDEIRLRLLQHVLAAWGSGGEPPRMQSLEDLLERLSAGAPFAATLGGCRIERRTGRIVATREPGRKGLPTLHLAPGDVRLWDNRFRVACAPGCPGPVVVRPLTFAEVADALASPARAGSRLTALSRRAMLTLPSFWRDDRLLAIAPPAFDQNGEAGLSAEFIYDISVG